MNIGRTVALLTTVAAIVAVCVNVTQISRLLRRIRDNPAHVYQNRGSKNATSRPWLSNFEFRNEAADSDVKTLLLVLDKLAKHNNGVDNGRAELTVFQDGRCTIRHNNSEDSGETSKLPDSALQELQDILLTLADVVPGKLKSELEADRERVKFRPRTLQFTSRGRFFAAEWWDESRRPLSIQVSDVYRRVRGLIIAGCFADSAVISFGRQAICRDVHRFFPTISQPDERCLPVDVDQIHGRSVLTFEWTTAQGLAIAQLEHAGGGPPFVRFLEVRADQSRAIELLGVSEFDLLAKHLPRVKGFVVAKSDNNAVKEFSVTVDSKRSGLRRFTDGQFVWNNHHSRYDDHILAVEAEDFRPVAAAGRATPTTVSRRLYRLPPDQGIAGIVTDVDGHPVSGATVALADGDRRAFLRDGWLHDVYDPGKPLSRKKRDLKPVVVRADSNGQFVVPDWTSPAIVAAAHPECGFAICTTDDIRGGTPLTMIPWASVKGIVTWQDSPTAGAEIDVSVYGFDSVAHGGRLKIPYSAHTLSGAISAYRSVETGKDGTFHFPYLPPGVVNIGHKLKSRPGGIRFSHPNLNNIPLVAAQCLQVTFGGRGKAIVGKLTGRKSWKGVTVSLWVKEQKPLRVLFPPHDVKYNRELAAAQRSFRESFMGAKYYRHRIPVADDGSFRIEGVPASKYNLRAEGGKGTAEGPIQVWNYSTSIDVPPFAESEAGQEIDLGTIGKSESPTAFFQALGL